MYLQIKPNSFIISKVRTYRSTASPQLQQHIPLICCCNFPTHLYPGGATGAEPRGACFINLEAKSSLCLSSYCTLYRCQILSTQPVGHEQVTKGVSYFRIYNINLDVVLVGEPGDEGGAEDSPAYPNTMQTVTSGWYSILYSAQQHESVPCFVTS